MFCTTRTVTSHLARCKAPFAAWRVRFSRHTLLPRRPVLQKQQRTLYIQASSFESAGSLSLEDLRSENFPEYFAAILTSGVWDAFWRDPLDFIDLGSDLTEEELAAREAEALELVEAWKETAGIWWLTNVAKGNGQGDAEASNAEEQPVEGEDEVYEPWSNQKEPNEVLETEEVLKGLRGNFRGQEEIDPYDKLKSMTQNWTEWDCRAFAEKKRGKLQENEKWQRRMAEVGRYQYLNVTGLTDSRLYREDEDYTLWYPEEVVNMITNKGTNADPFFMFQQEGIEVLNPEAKCDYFLLGIGYQLEAVDVVQEMGLTMTLPPPPTDESSDPTLAEEFSDFEEDFDQS